MLHRRLILTIHAFPRRGGSAKLSVRLRALTKYMVSEWDEGSGQGEYGCRFPSASLRSLRLLRRQLLPPPLPVLGIDDIDLQVEAPTRLHEELPSLLRYVLWRSNLCIRLDKAGDTSARAFEIVRVGDSPLYDKQPAMHTLGRVLLEQTADEVVLRRLAQGEREHVWKVKRRGQ